MHIVAPVLLILAAIPGAAARNAVRASLVFEPNLGQTDPRVSYLARGRGYTVFLTPQEYVLGLAASTPEVGPPDPTPLPAVRLRFVGANPAGKLEGRGELPGKSSYFRGNDPECWLGSVPSFARVVHEGLYPGVRAEVYGNGRDLEYDLVLEPGVRREIEMEFTGASELALSAEGDLVVRIRGGEVIQSRPRVYQEIGGERRAVPARYRLTGGLRAAIELEPVAPAARVVVDPEIKYSTYLGGSADEDALDLLVDAQGYIYLAGSTVSPDFPAGNPLAVPRGGRDGFLVKLDPTGETVVHSLYFGGSGDDTLHGVALGPGGELHLCGGTTSTTDFPLLNPYQNANAGMRDAYVAKLDPGGDTLLFSTFFGGRGDDEAVDLGIDASGRIYFTGSTPGQGFPIVTPVFQSAHGGGSGPDAFAAALTPDGQPIYSGYLGGSSSDYAAGILVDAQGYALVYGQTELGGFPVKNAYQSMNGGSWDGFLTKLQPNGADAVFSTFFGFGNVDYISSAAIDPGGVIHVAGSTYSGSCPFPQCFPDTRTPPEPPHLEPDFFVARFSADGQQKLYSTRLGGDAIDDALGVGVDDQGNTYLAGYTTSNDMYTPNKLDLRAPFTQDAFVAKLSADGQTVEYASYLSGAGDERVLHVAVNGSGTAYLAGTTTSPDLLVDPGMQPGNAGAQDVFLLVIGPLLEGSGAALEPSVEVGAPVGFQIQLENRGVAPVTNLVLEDVFPTPALDTSAFDPLVHVTTSAPAFPGWAGGKLTLTFSNPIPPGGKETVLITGLTAATAGVHTNEATLIHQTEENLTVAMDFVIGDPGTLPAPVTGLQMAKLATGLRIRWEGTDPLAPRYNLWRQRAGKSLIPVTNAVTARRDKRILATCSAVPQVNPLTTCLQANAIPGTPGVEFYQVRGLNAADLEGD